MTARVNVKDIVMYYNLDIKTGGAFPYITRKVTKVSEGNLEYYIKLYLTDDNEVIITKYHL